MLRAWPLSVISVSLWVAVVHDMVYMCVGLDLGFGGKSSMCMPSKCLGYHTVSCRFVAGWLLSVWKIATTVAQSSGRPQ